MFRLSSFLWVKDLFISLATKKRTKEIALYKLLLPFAKTPKSAQNETSILLYSFFGESRKRSLDKGGILSNR